MRQLLKALLDLGGRWLTAIVVLLALATVLGAEWIEGSQPWITLALIIILAVYLLMRLNYERFRERDEKAKSAEVNERKAELLEKELVDCQKRLQVSQAQHPVFRDFFGKK